MEKLSTEFLIFILGLKKKTIKEYSRKEPSTKSVYVFHGEEEFYQYFQQYGVSLQDKELLSLTVLFRLKNGDIIAFKGLCDHIIKMKMEADKNMDFETYNSNGDDETTLRPVNEKLLMKQFKQ